jgi:glucose-6-phosphate dehydrogenase assembly protein OpcA
MGAHLDAVYEETYEHINRVVREEEALLEGKRKKAKPYVPRTSSTVDQTLTGMLIALMRPITRIMVWWIARGKKSKPPSSE